MMILWCCQEGKMKSQDIKKKSTGGMMTSLDNIMKCHGSMKRYPGDLMKHQGITAKKLLKVVGEGCS